MNIYIIEREDWPYLERVWAYCQQVGIPMYKTRVTRYQTNWVVELDHSSPYATRFLLEFGQSTTNVMGTYYV